MTESKHKHVIDRSKLRRQRTKYREDIRLEKDHLFGLVNSFYVDGRKDATINFNRAVMYGVVDEDVRQL